MIPMRSNACIASISKRGEAVVTQYPAIYNIAYKSGPRAAVLIDRPEGEVSRAYSLGGVGHLHCFDAKVRRNSET